MKTRRTGWMLLAAMVLLLWTASAGAAATQKSTPPTRTPPTEPQLKAARDIGVQHSDTATAERITNAANAAQAGTMVVPPVPKDTIENNCEYINPGDTIKPFLNYDPPHWFDDRQTRTAIFCYDWYGRQLNPNPYPINENDKIVIRVIVPSSLAHQVIIKVVGDSKTQVSGRVAQTGIQTPAKAFQVGDTQKKGFEGDTWAVVSYYVDPITSGKMQITISNQPQATAKEPGSSYDVYVNHLYHFRPQIGVVYTSLPENEYGLVTAKNGKNRITIKDGGNENIQYMAALAIYPSGRDLTLEPPRISFQRLAWLLGFGLDNPTENLFLGATYDVGKGAYLSAGLHLGYREVLDAGYRTGDVFTGSGSDIPTHEIWTIKNEDDNLAWFVSINLDPVVLADLFRITSINQPQLIRPYKKPAKSSEEPPAQ